MRSLGYCQQAWTNLRAASLRSLLAALGILVGTAAVVALMSSGRLATDKALAQFKTLGTNIMAVSLFQKEQSRQGSLPLVFWRELPQKIPALSRIAPYASAYPSLSFKGQMLQGVVIGADESLAKIAKIKLAQGSFVSFLDSFEHYAVIGSGIAEQIKEQGLESPLGNQLLIDDLVYTIIGIAKPWSGGGFFTEDINLSVIIPVAGMSLIAKDSQISAALIQLKPEVSIDGTISNIKKAIYTLVPSAIIYTRSAKELIASMESQNQIFSLLLVIIASISLLVGGIGIMNIMLVSVSERKKEIGIRKALGATNSEIQLLFLTEAMMLALLGGVLGLLCGLIFTRLLAYFSDWPYHVYFLPLFLSFFSSVFAGVFFGFYPAHRAAILPAIASLRED